MRRALSNDFSTELAILRMDAFEQELARQLDVRGRREDPAQAGRVVRIAGVELELEAPALGRLLGLGEQPLAAGPLLGAGERVEDQRAGLGQRLRTARARR